MALFEIKEIVLRLFCPRCPTLEQVVQMSFAEEQHKDTRVSELFLGDSSSEGPATVSFAILAILFYMVLLSRLKSVMARKDPFDLRFLLTLNNFFISAASAILLALLIPEVVNSMLRHGLVGSWCSARAYTPWLETLYWVNYLAKYYELLDTLFLVLRKKPLTFLHVYHHSATLLLTAIQLQDRTVVQWVPISLNLAVHTLMYWYYGAKAQGWNPWWKKHLTSLQIGQFIVDVAVCFYCSWLYFQGDCSTTLRSSVIGSAILGSYLLLFIRFFSLTYQKPKDD